MKTVFILSLLGLSALTSSAARPPTLLDLSGARWPAARLSDSVLVIVDAQRGYTEGALALPGIGPAADNIAALLKRARAAGTPVIHVVQHGKPGGAVFASDSTAIEIIPALQPAPGETVIIKRLPSSFTGTTLAATLEKSGRKNLIVVGFMTHMCVSTTVRAALDHGYRCTVVANACGTRDLPDGHGGVIAAADLHRMELAALADRFATIVESGRAITD